MRFTSQRSEIKLKQLGLVTLFVGGLAMHAFAEATPPSLPALPELPKVPSAPLPGQNINNIKENKAEKNLPTAALSVSQAVPVAASGEGAASVVPLAKVTGSSTPPITGAGLLPPPPPEISETNRGTEATAVAQTAPLPPIAALPEVNVPTTVTPPEVPDVALPAPGMKFLFPKIKVVQEKAPLKTWETTLAPAIMPVSTRFNYKRQVLPETIYRRDYGYDNRHLPHRVTRGDYEGLLFTSIARRDMDATRALLNAGTDINATNAYGETPRAFAERIGAMDVAAMLTARGGR